MTRTLTALIAALAFTATLGTATMPAIAWIDVLSIDAPISSGDLGSGRVRGVSTMDLGSGR